MTLGDKDMFPGAAQADLVEVLHTLSQVLNYKGT